MPTFVLNDENVVNSYGFRVRNSGISFARFDANPVMLDSHQNRTSAVMGSWKDRRIEGSLLKMDTNFDMELDEAKRLSGQVDRKFVKGASLGLAISWEDEPFQRQPDGKWDLVKSECTEGSICGVPSNSGSLCLYDKATGEPISEDQIKLSLEKLSGTVTPNINDMQNFKLSAPALAVLVNFGLQSAESESEINAAVMALSLALKSEKDKNINLQTQMDKNLKLQAEKLVDDAIGQMKLTAGEREDFVQLAVSNLELATKLINAKPGKTSLTKQVDNSVDSDPKSWEDFGKLTLQQQLAFKEQKPDAYNALFN